MTRHRIDQAVVMDTDDIPGRGGYALAGMSDGVAAAERLFVAQNFGISDFLHDPQNQRTFYSFFRVPGGRRALVRRFARGHRRNQTQNRLFVHTLFIEDALFEALDGVPWLLIQDLPDEVPGLVVDAPLPPLTVEIDPGIVSSLPERLRKRLDVVQRQLGASAVAAVLTNLARHGRISLPQGVAFELLTMLAWSMLPRPDREAMAWTQHDAQNIAGVSFELANVPDGARMRVDGAVHPVANLVVAMSTASDEERRQFDTLTLKNAHSIRDIERIGRWLAWREALGNVKENIRASDVLAHLTELAHTAEGETDTWIDGGEVLEILWNNIPAAVAAGENPAKAVERWGHLLRDSGLHALIFREPPGERWLQRAASEVGADLLVRFFIFGTDAEPGAAPVRDAVARWLLDGNGKTLKPDTLARLALRLAGDASPFARGILELLLSSGAGVVALQKLTPMRAELSNFALDAARIAVREKHGQTAAFLTEVLIPHLELTPRLGARITHELAKDIAATLRANPDVFLRFSAHLQPELAAALHDTITEWMFADPKGTARLAGAILPQVVASTGAASASPLAFELARAAEPAHVWFGVLLERAAAIDTRGERRASRDFTDAVERLRMRSPRLDGALDLLARLLETAAASGLRVGDCVRALILLLRPAWKENPRRIMAAARALVQQTKLAAGWEPVIEAMVAELGASEKLRPSLSALVTEYWLTVDPTEVPKLGEAVVRAIRILDVRDRRRLSEEWLTRLRRLPESPATDLLFAALFPQRDTRELFVTFAQREIDQGLATPETLKRLDAAFRRRADYATEMSNAVDRYLRTHDPVRRIAGYFVLLGEPLVPQTVKTLVETKLLPKALHDLEPDRWDAVRASVGAPQLFARGVPVMSVGYEVGLRGPEPAQRAFESDCRAGRRIDGLHALGEGRRRRGALQWALRAIGRDRPLVAE